MKRICMHCKCDLQPLHEKPIHPHAEIPPVVELPEELKGMASHGICDACMEKFYPDPDAEPKPSEEVCQCGYSDHGMAQGVPCPNCEV